MEEGFQLSYGMNGDFQWTVDPEIGDIIDVKRTGLCSIAELFKIRQKTMRAYRFQ